MNIIDDSFDHEFGTQFEYHCEVLVEELRIVGDEHSIFKGVDLQALLVEYFNEMSNDDLIEMGLL